eukprot:TRINITY_DN33352_c0_g1_i1.p1 TRINITY_DN33352_c0_g1~~TRINITY_DN33352_c0_g1_i1.p1  ORF type:complete len:139 (+),score=32.22 TRINITY_DN33352_c0_g1_i1:30-446(+)
MSFVRALRLPSLSFCIISGCHHIVSLVFFLNDTATTEIYTLHIVGSVRCVQETGYQDINQDRFFISQCKNECALGIERMNQYINKEVNAFYEEFSQCMRKTQQGQKNSINEVFSCYDKMLNGFSLLQKNIYEEFSNYE